MLASQGAARAHAGESLAFSLGGVPNQKSLLLRDPPNFQVSVLSTMLHYYPPLIAAFLGVRVRSSEEKRFARRLWLTWGQSSS